MEKIKIVDWDNLDTDRLHTITSVEIEENVFVDVYWENCIIEGCNYKCCVRLKSNMCYKHLNSVWRG